MTEIRVCAPKPPNCGSNGWLVPKEDQERRGILCESSLPDASELMAPDAPTCDDHESDDIRDAGVDEQPNSDDDKPSVDSKSKRDDSGCSILNLPSSDGAPLGFGLGLLGTLLLTRRRRTRLNQCSS